MNSVDILLAPYNYVITENIQKAIKLKIKNKILIFDEGHNIENFLEDSSSLCLSKTSLLTVIGDKKL
jgi:Rad3-related DNA helicase